jgi:oligopeptide/dipeptide ABC transporter ATP-binding protein
MNSEREDRDANSSIEDPLLIVEGLTTHFDLGQRLVKAVQDVGFVAHRGQIMGIVGESGSGKTMTGLSILRLVPAPGRIVSGRVTLNGVDLLKASEDSMEKTRGSEATMIFQNPRAALDPFFSIGDQLVETARFQMNLKGREAREQAIEFLSAARVQNTDHIMRAYPHQLSGGECQRVMIAMALLCRPQLLIADEPTSALDAKIQSELLDLLIELKDKFRIGIVLITHDFSVIEQVADSVNVMYAGKIVEAGPATEVLSSPQHPYTIGLLKSVPKIGQANRILTQLDGQPPDASALPPGCAFAARCRERVPFCEDSEPQFQIIEASRMVRCHLRGDVPNDLTS